MLYEVITSTGDIVDKNGNVIGYPDFVPFVEVNLPSTEDVTREAEELAAIEREKEKESYNFV